MSYADKDISHWKEGDLVFVSYKNRYYGVITEIQKAPYPGNDHHKVIVVRRTYDEYGEPAVSKGLHSYDPWYLTRVDEEYLKLQKKRYDRVVELYKEHNGQRRRET